MKVIITDSIDFTREQTKRLKSLGKVVVYKDVPSGEKEIIRRIKGAEIITTNWIKISKNVMKNVPTLKNIIVAAIGYDKVDIEFATRKGIKVSNCPDYCVNAVAEHTIALIFALTRNVVNFNSELLRGDWKLMDSIGTEISGKCICCIGRGKIGRKVGNLASNLGMKVCYIHSKTSENEIMKLLSMADIVSLHIPIKEDTKHFMNKERIRMMKKGAYLVNTSRGEVVDQEALYQVIKAEHLAGAALDVFENEPESGRVNREIRKLLKLDNVVATPHVAYKTKESIVRQGDQVIENIMAAIERSPINVVN